jgi:hypothetical protein
MGLAVCLLYGVKNARAAGSALEACERGETPPPWRAGNLKVIGLPDRLCTLKGNIPGHVPCSRGY